MDFFGARSAAGTFASTVLLHSVTEGDDKLFFGERVYGAKLPPIRREPTFDHRPSPARQRRGDLSGWLRPDCAAWQPFAGRSPPDRPAAVSRTD